MTAAVSTDGEGAEVATGSLSPPRLPRAGSGERARRRRQERRRHRRRHVARATLALTLAVAVAGAAWALARPEGRSPAPGGVAAGDAPPVASAPGPVALLVQPGEDGQARSLTVVALGPGGRGGHAVLVPPGTMTEVPAFGLEAVGRSLRDGGVPLLQATVENLLGVGVEQVAVLDDASLIELVRPAGDLVVDVPERVEQVGADGRVAVLWDPGEQLVGSLDVPRLLADKGEGTDLARLARQQAFWRAWLARMAADPVARPADAAAAGAGRFVRALAEGPARAEMLPVKAVDAGSDGDMYQVREADLEALARRAFPGADLAASGRIRVQVLNGTGTVGLARDVTVRLVQPPTRARVLFTGNAERFDHEVTEVVFYRRNQQEAAERIRAALGVGRLVLSRRPIGVVDVTVVVGRDFVGATGAGGPS